MRSIFKKIIFPFRHWILLLVLIPVLELFLLLQFFGTLWTLLLTLFGGMLGVLIAQREAKRHWNELNQFLDRGESPMVPIVSGLLVIFGALLTILPGLVTFLLGLFLLFPLTRLLVVTHLMLQFKSYRLYAQKGSDNHSPVIIDV